MKYFDLPDSLCVVYCGFKNLSLCPGKFCQSLTWSHYSDEGEVVEGIIALS